MMQALKRIPGGIADYTILPSGTFLYRFSGWDILRADNSVSPWWSETSGLLDTLEGAKKWKDVLGIMFARKVLFYGDK
ncbi:MAG: hypothetical protein R2822_27295 [Spirosomataceae bacterium]